VGCPNETYVHNLPPKAWPSEVGSNSQFHFVNTQTGKGLAWARPMMFAREREACMAHRGFVLGLTLGG
jgi:hypothetical protein